MKIGIQSLRIVPLLCILASALSVGCRDDTGPAPPGGYNMAAMSYKPPPVPEASVYLVSEMPLSPAPETMASISIPAELAPQSPLALEGMIRVPDPDQAGGVVYVEFFQMLPNGERLITQMGQQVVVWTDSPDGHIHYRVEMTAPAKPGKHRVEMRLVHPPTAPEPILFAAGQTTVSKP